MNLDELRAVQVDERGTDSLQPLPDSFYRDVAAYIEDLREERERAAERADNPFDSEEVRRLTDEIETAEEVVEAVYERRVGKVVKRASLAAAGMSADDEGLTDEESALFSDLVDRIETNRAEILAVFDGDTADGSGERAGDGVASPTEDPPVPDPEESVLDAGNVMGGAPDEPAESGPRTETPPDAVSGSEPVESAHATDPTPSVRDGAENEPPTRDAEDTDRVTLRITRDVGEIFGVDARTYELGEEDVVTLPEENAKPLLDRDAAQKL